jgi:transcriptional regulator with XRE-family HTH domain
VLSGQIDLICAHVSRILREEREKRHLSMTIVAKRAGLSRAMISFVERDLRTPSLETMLRITHVLELDLGKVIQKAVAAAKRGN